MTCENYLQINQTPPWEEKKIFAFRGEMDSKSIKFKILYKWGVTALKNLERRGQKSLFRVNLKLVECGTSKKSKRGIRSSKRSRGRRGSRRR